MKLSQLIETTLNEIAIGVRSAKETSRNVMVIAPGTLEGKVVGEISYIEFDVSIVVEESDAQSSSKEKGIGGEIRVLSIGGLSGKSQNSRGESRSLAAKSTHRVAFKVPVCMAAEYISK
jgi:hypothetical protein